MNVEEHRVGKRSFDLLRVSDVNDRLGIGGVMPRPMPLETTRAPAGSQGRRDWGLQARSWV